jgi:hypothetical protein
MSVILSITDAGNDLMIHLMLEKRAYRTLGGHLSE